MLRISQEALTFDDILLVPGYSEVLPNEVNLKTRLTRGIELNIPLVSAAMDTVTEARLAIAMAQEGGIGIIHKNMTIEQKAHEVRKVKRLEAGVVKEPITIEADATVRELLELTRQHNISGVPVLHNGDLVGIVTSRDVRFENRLEATVRDVMTPKERLVTVKEGADKEEARELLHKHRIERVLIVDDNFALKGMMTVNDIEKAKAYPLASKDDQGRLRVGAAVGTGKDTADRVAALVAAGVDVVVVDTAHGHSKGVIDRVRWVKQNFPQVQVIGGNIATGAAALALAEAGADAVKVGIGPGSICTTRIVAGVGVPQISAIANVAAALEGTGVPLIADGGIRFSGDQSIGLQLLERGTNRRSAHVKKFGQGGLAQLHPRSQRALADCLVNPLIDAVDRGFEFLLGHLNTPLAQNNRPQAMSSLKKRGLHGQINPVISRLHPDIAYNN